MVGPPGLEPGLFILILQPVMVERFLELLLKFEIESTYRSLLTNTHYLPLGSYKHFHLEPHMKQRDFLIQYFCLSLIKHIDYSPRLCH